MVVGGSLFSAATALITGQLPEAVMLQTAQELKLWAILASLGGSFTTMRSLEGGFTTGRLDLVLAQLLHIVTAFAGAHLALILLDLMLRPA